VCLSPRYRSRSAGTSPRPLPLCLEQSRPATGLWGSGTWRPRITRSAATSRCSSTSGELLYTKSLYDTTLYDCRLARPRIDHPLTPRTKRVRLGVGTLALLSYPADQVYPREHPPRDPAVLHRGRGPGSALLARDAQHHLPARQDEDRDGALLERNMNTHNQTQVLTSGIPYSCCNALPLKSLRLYSCCNALPLKTLRLRSPFTRVTTGHARARHAARRLQAGLRVGYHPLPPLVAILSYGISLHLTGDHTLYLSHPLTREP